MNARLKLVSILTLTCLIASSLFFVSPAGVQSVSAASTAQYGGFLYAWGGTKYLIQNVHPAGANAIDVTSSSSGYQEFDILAPKDGVVVDYEDRFPRTQGVSGCPSNYIDFTNYVLLGHGPKTDDKYQTYTLYYHLKQGSVSSSGLGVDAFVQLGEKIGVAGDTGAWNNIIHLHMEMSTNPKESLHRNLNCNGVNLSDTHYWHFDPIDSIPMGFEEFGNQWPLLSGGTGNLTSNNWTGIQQNDCDPRSYSTKVALYNHIDYGGECVIVPFPEDGMNVPGSMQISSIYLNPLWLTSQNLYRTLTLWSGYNQTGDSVPISNSAPNLIKIGWNDRVKSVHNAAHLNVPWLLEEGYAFDAPFDVNVHIRVSNDPDFNAWRVCFDAQNCQENAAPINELYYTWNTFGWADGNHTISVQYRRTSDNNDWNNADYYETYFYLSPNRQTYAPCGTNVDGARLVSGSDCIIVTTNVMDMNPVGWGGRSNLQITAQGYDVLAYDASDFQGTPKLVRDGQTINAGSLTTGIELRDPLPDPYVPEEPLGADANTIVYLPMDEGSGSYVYNQVGSLTGTLTGSASFTTGLFGTGVQASRPPENNGISFGAQNFGSPLTIEMFVKMDSVNGDQRLAMQFGGGPNTGNHKWLIGVNAGRFRVWSCWISGCPEAYSLENIQTNRWYYLMYTYDGNRTAKLYVDSVLQVTFDTDGTMPGGSTTFEIAKGENISGCNCTIDDFRISNIVREPVGPPAPIPPASVGMDFNVEVTNPVSKEVTAFVSWTNAAYDWHIIDWGDSSDYGMQGNNDTRTVTHNYANAGTYTLTFDVHGPDDVTYTLTDQVTVSDYACGEAVTLPGVVLYDYMTCASASASDKVQFTELGLYNLEDYYFDNMATSMHLPADGSLSVRLYEGIDGTGQSVCRQWGDMWNMVDDDYPDETPLDDTVSSIEIFDTNGCVPHPTMSMDPVFLDPHGLIQLDVAWSGGAEAWQMIDWGDESDYGIYGASGSQSPTHWYPGPGTYTITFTVTNASPDWGEYPITQEVTVGSYSCGGGVTQSGVVFFAFSGCAYRDSADIEQFDVQSGNYNLSVLDNAATSLHVPSGMSVRLYEGANQTGESWCSSWDMWNFADDHWPSTAVIDNTVTSFTVYSNTTCTP